LAAGSVWAFTCTSPSRGHGKGLRTKGKLEKHQNLLNLGQNHGSSYHYRCTDVCLEAISEMEESQKHDA
jgi:hypothetical protein